MYSFKRRAIMAALTPVTAIALFGACSDSSDDALVATNAPTTVESNVCAGDVVVVEWGEYLDCDVVPPQRLDVEAWTDAEYGPISSDEFLDFCNDSGGALHYDTSRTDFWLCEGVDY